MDKLTEWDLAQIRLGNLKAPEKAAAREEIIYDIAARDVERVDLATASLDALDELDDDDNDERKLIEQLRTRRLAELRSEAEAARFGELREIKQDEYLDEVSRCDDWIVLHMYQSYLPDCKLMNAHLARLAPRFPATKFLSIVATSCIPGYPDANLPTVFVYHNKDIVQQFVTLRSLHGSGTRADDVEWALARTGAIKTDMEEDPRADEEQMTGRASSYIGVRPRLPDEDEL